MQRALSKFGAKALEAAVSQALKAELGLPWAMNSQPSLGSAGFSQGLGCPWMLQLRPSHR